jgi:hypothetical protein
VEEVKKVLVDFAVKAFKLNKAEATSMLFETEGDSEKVKSDALDNLLKADATRIKVISDEKTEEFQKGYKKGKKETASTLEEAIKESFGISSDKQGLELIAEAKEVKTGKSELTDDDLKKHPFYIKAEKRWLKDKEDAVNEERSKVERERNAELLVKTARENLMKLKPKVSADPKKAERQLKPFDDEIRGLNYEKKGDDFILLDKDGKRLEDEHGHPIMLSEYSKKLGYEIYEFEEEDNRSSGGNPNDKGQGSGGSNHGGINIKKPATEEEYSAQFAELEKLPDDTRIPAQAKLTELFKG